MPVRTEGHTGPAIMGDLRNDMMLLLSPSTSLDNLSRQPWTGQCIPRPVSLGDSGPASVAIPGRPVQTSQY